MHSPVIIGICGGSASGKSTISDHLADRLQHLDFGIIRCDSFYKSLPAEEIARAHRNEFNFDDPSAIDFDELVKKLCMLKRGKSVEIPVYDFSRHTRSGDFTLFRPHRFVVVEGMLIFANEKLRDMLDIKVYVHCDDDVRVARKIKRDVECRGRSIDYVMKAYFQYCKPCHIKLVEPGKIFADVILDNSDGIIGSEGLSRLCDTINSTITNDENHPSHLNNQHKLKTTL